MVLQREFVSLKESNLKEFSIPELQNKHKDLQDLWTRIINVAYNAERAISSIIYMKQPLWHDILSLSDVIEEVKLIKCGVKRIQDQHRYDIDALNSETSSNPLLPLQANIPMVDKLVVGFKDEVEEILDRLIRGSEELDIISIVGMAGLGKTTLAKKVYSDASVGYHFNKCAWCTISQTVNIKRMLLDLVNDLGIDCKDPSRKTEEDLAQIVYKSLKGQRFLIVMDDIWDVSAWDALKMSFPDDDKGSRIMFTSRNHKVVSEAKSGCSPFRLNPLSQEESWELLEKKLFIQDGCPDDFVEIGKKIARNCRGLPLAVVLVAGLLKKALGSLSWWEQVGESLDELIAKEGCTDLLELSYKHLPEVLKPCFLYLGSFAEDEEIRVKKLTQLWISEGFIPKQEIKSLEVIAEEYLVDLVARSLVIVTKRSSTGGIKSCVVHDLLHDFCIAKGEEQKVFKVIGLNEISGMASRCAAAHYRVRIQTGCWRSFLGSEPVPPASPVHSILSLHPFFDKKRSGYEGIKNPNFSHLKFLQVLDLDLNLVVEEFPEGITELILLRYLAMKFYITIPPSIKKLVNLETLHLYPPSGRIVFNLPVTLLEMRKLRHVNIAPVRIPRDLRDDIPSLENVQTCSFVVLSPIYAERFWRKIPNVRKLKCHFEKWGHDLNFDSLRHLESLFVRYAYGYSPHGRPEWCSGVISFPSTLKKLTLMDFRLPWSNISPIAKLPNLEALKLVDGCRGKTWNVGDDEFPNLKFLKLHRVEVEELNATDGCFPCLEHLVVEYCSSLKEIPSSFGSILTLNMIQIAQGTPTLKESARQIQEEQAELGNDQLEVLFTEKYQEPYHRFLFGHIR